MRFGGRRWGGASHGLGRPSAGVLWLLALLGLLGDADAGLADVMRNNSRHRESRGSVAAEGRSRALTSTFAFQHSTTTLLLELPSWANGNILWSPGDTNCDLQTPCYIRGLYAGVAITLVEVTMSDAFVGTDPRVRVVRETVTTELAHAGFCQAGLTGEDRAYGAHAERVYANWDVGESASTQGTTLQIQTDLAFKMGGTYRICYSPDNGFASGNADVVYPTLDVYGLYDDNLDCYQDETCLTKRPYRCYLLREAYNNMYNEYNITSNCILDFTYTGAGFTGPAGFGSWSASFPVTYDSDGMVTSVTEKACGEVADQPASFLCNTGSASCDAGTPFISPNETSAGLRIHMPIGRSDLVGDSFAAHTIAACYCPSGSSGLGRCEDFQYYTQQVGVLHYYVSKVCPAGYPATACEQDFTGTTPLHKFSLRIMCPTDACSASTGSRVRIVAQTAVNDLPTWSTANGCAASSLELHGKNSMGRDVLPAHINPDMEGFHGGLRQDRKQWNWWNVSGSLSFNVSEAGFLFVWGESGHELRSAHSGETFDVCYCDMDCGVSTNWFKVGQLRFTPFQLVSAASSASATQSEFLVEFRNQPGSLGFYRPPTDYGIQGLQENGTIKLVADPLLTLDDAGCTTAQHDAAHVEVAGGDLAAEAFQGRRSADGRKLVFNGGDVANTITVKQAGYTAVCYCPTGSCDEDSTWVLTHRLTVRGPDVGQSWTFSTHVTFGFEYTGFGLSSSDRLRIIPATSDCSDTSGDPSGAFTSTFIKLQCPSPCNQVGDISDEINGDIEVKVLADDAYSCDENNLNCLTNDITAIRVLDESTTELEFKSAPGLEVGDHISVGAIDDNIVCNPTDVLDNVCNDERLAMLKGRFPLVDSTETNGNPYHAPDEYIAGHRVLSVSDNKVTIGVGWKAPVPRFIINYVNNKQGTWTRHNKARTKQEIMGTKALTDLKICWKYPERNGLTPTYVAEVGTLTLVDPNPLADCLVSLTSTVKDQGAATGPLSPFIVSFRTGEAETGRKYAQVEGYTRLRLKFNQVSALDVRFVDGTRIQVHQGEDEQSEARQYICGKLFKELWSSDRELGFPMPRGCFYQVYGDTIELNIVFDKRNGLRGGYDYQLVLYGIAHDEAVQGGEYLEILTMDDTELKPYEAIERGLAALSQAPVNGAFGSDGVRFAADDGLQIIGGSNDNTLELVDGQTIRIQLQGDPAGGGITPSSILRLWLWPLTQWDLASQCTVVCEPYNQVTHPCGAIQSCKGIATIPNFQRNALKVVLPASMTAIDSEVSHILEFSGLTFPTGGIFPTTLGAQISTASDTKPHYIESTGDFFIKSPNEGHVIGRLVNYYGDGNQNPFRGDTLNVLYVQIVLAATLFSPNQLGDAMMTVTLPEGYECVQPAVADASFESPWSVQETLGAFGGVSPQGTGSPDNRNDGLRGWSVSGNACTYTLRQNAVVYAGSSLYVKVTVNNPDTPLRRDDANNKWSLTLSSKGSSTVMVDMPAVTFTAATANFSENVAVLGRISDASLVPLNFAVTPDIFSVQTGSLRIFFQTEQSTGIGAFVRLQAPASFGFDPCTASDLADEVYARYTDTVSWAHQDTRRLPQILSCQVMTDPYPFVQVGLEGELMAATRYGFELGVTNPMVFAASQQEEWRLFTLSSQGFLVDGTPDAVQLARVNVSLPENIAGFNRSFGLYRYTLSGVEISLSTTAPGELAEVTVRQLRVPVDANTTLRIVAPYGYVWETADGGFNASLGGGGASAELPGGAPVADGNVLLWADPSMYLASSAYGFSALARVPIVHPTASANEFLVELGHGEAALEGRIAAGVVAVSPVSRLVNAAVDYATNVALRESALAFQIQTVTHVPEGGVLTIHGPSGFAVAAACVLEAAPMARGAPYDVAPTVSSTMAIPDDAACTAAESSGSAGGLEISLTAGASGLPPALYRFQIAATNPDASEPVADALQPCGYSCCWHFETFSTGAGTADVQLDAPASTPCFAVQTAMGGAQLVELSLAQQQKTQRDDRPTRYNPLVFAFQPASDAPLGDYLHLRAPEGFLFRENCLEDVETRASVVLGDGESLPQGFSEFPQGASFTSCRGQGPDAALYFSPGSTVGLKGLESYLMRVAVLQNPEHQPAVNEWSIEFNGESSVPFAGFDLWTLTRTTIDTVSTARSTSVLGESMFVNPVTITFRPRNTVGGVGAIMEITAPPYFRVAHTDYVCNVLIQPLNSSHPPGQNYDGPPSLYWGDGDVSCNVNPQQLSMMTVIFKATYREFLGDSDYQVTVYVNNPTVSLSQEAAGEWTLQTYQSSASSTVLPTFRDLATISGFTINEKASGWYYQNEGFYRGKEDVPSLYFEANFPQSLETGDVILVEAPQGFYLSSDEGTNASCRAFTWEGDASLFLPNSRITCDGGTLRMEVEEPTAFPENQALKFRVNTSNPDKTPHIMVNHWKITHLDGAGVVVSSAAARSWEVSPQLDQVAVNLVGVPFAAGSLSGMSVSFMPVSEADELFLEVLSPPGFDFTGTTTMSLGHEVIATDGPRIRVQANILAFVPTTIIFGELTLGYPGGPTTFDLMTRLNNGVEVDERLQFSDGFLLPGRISVVSKTLLSLYNKDPVANPVSSLWQARMNEEAEAVFQFTMSMPAQPGTVLELRAVPYVLMTKNFTMEDSSGTSIAIREVNTTGDWLVAALDELLPADAVITIRIAVMAPSVALPADAIWSFRVLCGGTGDCALPVSTNDASTEGFTLVEHIGIQVRAADSPPTAEIEAVLDIDPNSKSPEILYIIAPFGFNFTTDCLVSGADGQIVACEQASDVVGRAAAKLTCVAGGLTAKVEGVIIKVVAPITSAEDPSWYIDARDADGAQLGWGYDPIGFPVVQMLFSNVVYSGVPTVSGLMVFGFSTRKQVQGGGRVQVGFPSTFNINCDGAYLETLSLRGTVGCVSGDGWFELSLEFPLSIGQQAFAVTAIPPNAVNEPNVFYIKVLDPDRSVSDAAMGLPGYHIQHGFKTTALELIWSNSEASEAATVSLGFELLEDLPLQDPPIVSELVVTLPPDFVQQVTSAYHVEWLQKSLPYVSDNWVDASHPGKLRLLLDETQTGRLETGVYRFSFPVLVPTRMPAYNVFILTVCGPSDSSGAACQGPQDPRALVSFPIDGFSIGETHPAALQYTAGAMRTSAWLRWLWLPLACSYFCL